jgi:hypothetical protein
MNHRDFAITEDSSARYAKERQKLFGFAERACYPAAGARPRSPAANTSGINICADRWNWRFRKNPDSFRELHPAVSGEGGEER